MVVQQETTKADNVLCAIRSRDTLNRALQPPHQYRECRTYVAQLEDTVPMVALECVLPLSGRLSPPADAPMSLPSQPAVSCSRGEEDPQLLAAQASSVPSCSAGSRPDLKRKLCQRHEVPDEEQSFLAVVDGHQENAISSERCGNTGSEKPESKRRRLFYECSETESVQVEEATENNPEQPPTVLETVHVNSGVDQTLDLVTATEGEEQSLDLVDVPDNDTAIETDATSLDVVVETSGTPFVGDFPNTVSQDAPESVVEVNVVGEDEVRDDSSDLRQMPSTPAYPQQTDNCCADDMSSEEGDDDAFTEVCQPRPQRISPFLNTPKQRKEERRKVLKLSIHKMRTVEDPEHFLRRSVLINNTMKRLQRELREEKMRNSPRRSCYGLYRRASPFHYDALNHNNYVLLHDESFALGDNDRITDDMTDALVTRLEATSSHGVVPTPSPSPCPLDEPDTCLVDFPDSSCEDQGTLATSSLSSFSEVTSSVKESLSVMTTELTSSSLPGDPSSSEDLMSPVSESEAITSSVSELTSELTSSVSELTSSVSELAPSVSDLTSSVSELTSSSCTSSCSSTSPVSVTCSGVYEHTFPVNGVVRDCQSPSSSCSSESQREKQLYTDIDVVFNNLIHALGDS